MQSSSAQEIPLSQCVISKKLTKLLSFEGDTQIIKQTTPNEKIFFGHKANRVFTSNERITPECGDLDVFTFSCLITSSLNELSAATCFVYGACKLMGIENWSEATKKLYFSE